MGNSINSFFKFVFGFSLFIAVSLGLTIAVTTYAMKRDAEKQTAAAFKGMLNQSDRKMWWMVWE